MSYFYAAEVNKSIMNYVSSNCHNVLFLELAKTRMNQKSKQISTIN